MAEITVKTCDRCGNEIERSQFPRIKFNAQIHTTNFFGFGSYDYTLKRHDLCKKCTQEFERWMDNE